MNGLNITQALFTICLIFGVMVVLTSTGQITINQSFEENYQTCKHNLKELNNDYKELQEQKQPICKSTKEEDYWFLYVLGIIFYIGSIIVVSIVWNRYDKLQTKQKELNKKEIELHKKELELSKGKKKR